MEINQKWQAAFITSCLFSLFCAELPPFSTVILLLMVSVCLIYKQKQLFAAATLGFCWFFLHSHHQISWSLPQSLIKQPISVIGIIEDIPSHNGKDSRFNLLLRQIQDEKIPFWQSAKLRLTWHDRRIQFQGGDKVKLQVKLKPAWGLTNDGGFNYQKWLMLNGIRATGYVIQSDSAVLLQSDSSYRQSLYNQLKSASDDLQYQGMILALTVGDKQLIGQSQWQTIQSAGISHLLAISGLHIGIVFVFAVFISKRLIKLFFLKSRIHVNAPRMALVGGFLCSVAYAYLAGFAIPTVRALLMLTVVITIIWLQKSLTPRSIIIHALFVILLVDPLSVLQPGLWLSVFAVVIIIAVFWRFPNVAEHKWQVRIISVMKMQLALFVLMLPLTMLLFNGFSASGVMVNLVAVPWVSFTTVPLALIGALFEQMGFSSSYILGAANLTLEWLFWLLDTLNVQQSWVTPKALPWSVWMLLMAFVITLCFPMRLSNRGLSILLIIPAVLSIVQSSSFKVNVLDVGQGLSIVIEHQGKVLVYDLGPVYKSGFNTVDAAVLPFLTFHGYSEIDKLIISHGDSDHSGAWQNLVDNVEIHQIIAPKKLKIKADLCKQSRQKWYGLTIELLWPIDTKSIPANSNDSSCVVRISNGIHSILMPGDISKRVEKKLVSRYGKSLKSDVLIAPHHGSNSSSTKGFINMINPDYVIYASGYLNRYHFPRKAVVERYKNIGAIGLNTAESGQLTLHMDGQEITVELARKHQFTHWYYNQ